MASKLEAISGILSAAFKQHFNSSGQRIPPPLSPPIPEIFLLPFRACTAQSKYIDNRVTNYLALGKSTLSTWGGLQNTNSFCVSILGIMGIPIALITSTIITWSASPCLVPSELRLPTPFPALHLLSQQGGMRTKSQTHAWFSKAPLIWGQYVLWWHAEWICYSLRIFIRLMTDWQSGGHWHEHQTPAVSIIFQHRVSLCHSARHLAQMNFMLNCHKSLFSICKAEKIAAKYCRGEKAWDFCKDPVDTATLAILKLS